ncbi:hypothetical protein TrLO_g3419 [Triparma laevis f. longispina]|uniref:Eukaryotic translation initiation factor 4E n=1 Tax=Triparma laevis f. longispina TaxID=1714387 RepID=A0A9W7CM36_9STRA|nr:hypothetical protein TrLO_g3419 [Triparma laevis f. longispina]
MAEEHPLENSWTFWHGDALEKDWSKKIQPICTFTTVENFWQYYNHIPKPGKCFFDGESRASVGPDNKVIDELSMFKKGIKPEWEDPQNRDGGCLFVRKTMDPLQVDHYWQNAILGLIGETLSPDICGVRIVDKGKRDNTMYRFEVWLKSNDQEVVRSVKEKFLRCISEGKDFKRGPPQFDWKKHK